MAENQRVTWYTSGEGWRRSEILSGVRKERLETRVMETGKSVGWRKEERRRGMRGGRLIPEEWGVRRKQTARILKFGLNYSSICIGQINSRWSGGAVASFPLVLVWTLANSLRFSCNCSGSCLNEISDKTISPACEGDTKKIIVYKCQSCVKMNTAYSSSLSRYSFWESDFLTMLFAFGSR